MHHDGKVKAIGRSQIPDEAHLTIFEDAAEGMSLRAWYGATYGMDFHAPKELWPNFEIEFDEPRSIQNYIVHVSDYVDFLSFCFGVKFKPSAISIDRLSLAEMRAALENRRYPGDHEVHYVWPEADINKRDLWVWGLAGAVVGRSGTRRAAQVPDRLDEPGHHLEEVLRAHDYELRIEKRGFVREADQRLPLARRNPRC
jgi:hypothetical protein